MRFRNDQDYPLNVYAVGQTVGPGAEFDWPGWSRENHGLIPGCSLLDDEAAETAPAGTQAATATGTPTPAATSTPAPGSGAASASTPPATAAGTKPSTSATAAASEETSR